MHSVSNESTFRLPMSSKGWELIDTALTAYAHMAVYRDLRDKLDMQVAMARAMDGAGRQAKHAGARSISHGNRRLGGQSR